MECQNMQAIVDRQQLWPFVAEIVIRTKLKYCGMG